MGVGVKSRVRQVTNTFNHHLRFGDAELLAEEIGKVNSDDPDEAVDLFGDAELLAEEQKGKANSDDGEETVSL